MKVPNSEHTSRPWRIHAVTSGFRLEDVWEASAAGGGDEFHRVVELAATWDPERSSSALVRLLFVVRWRLGELLGWDDPRAGVGARVPSLRERLPDDLRDGPRGPELETLPFSSLYLTDDEWAAEVANGTMHGILHLGRVPTGVGGSRVQMAIYVKPNGLAGRAYMAAIKPFRYLIVYPRMLREMERRWGAAGGPIAPDGASA